VDEAERVARERLTPAAYDYYAGGAEDEVTLSANVEAWRRWRVRYRVLVDVRGRDLSTTALGRRIAMPVGVAPTAFQRLAHADAEVATARAAAREGVPFVLSSLSTTRLEEVAKALDAAPENTDAQRWFQLYLYKDRKTGEALVARAERAGVGAIVLTADTPVLGRRERDLKAGHVIDARPANFDADVKPAGSGAAMLKEIFGGLDDGLTWRDVDWLRTITSLPILVKGVVHPDDARLALDHGAAGVVVSNHGGRQLDGAVASLEVLPEVVNAVGDRAEVYLDGGVRRGADVVMALALGARAVLVGRPALYGLAFGGSKGVEQVLEILREETENALALLGCRSPAEVTVSHVKPA